MQRRLERSNLKTVQRGSGNRVTILDVARAAGVSKSTVANVFSGLPGGVTVQEETRRRVLEAAQRLDYRKNAVAAAFSSGRTHTIGVLLPQHHVLATSRVYRTYGQDVFVAVFDAACRANLRVTSLPNLDREPRVADLTDRRVDGLILASLRDPDLVRAIYATGTPCVEIGSGFGPHLIHPDNEGGAALAVAHLTGLGHRRIAHFRGPRGGYSAADRRADGFESACRTHGLDPGRCPVLDTPEDVAEALGLPRGDRPTALFAFNDCQASDVLDIAEERGLRVPGDLSVVGFDNSVVSELTRPRLTTIDNALGAQADAAIALLLSLRDGSELPEPPAPAPVCVPTHLVPRHSTAPPARTGR